MAFTDEMSIEVGGTFGKSFVWRDKTEKWHQDCVGAMKKQGPTVMCWGMIGYGWKGPFYVWEVETDEEKKEAEAEIARINAEMVAEADKKNREWTASPEWAELKERELAAAKAQRRAEKNGAPKQQVPQSWRGKKYKVDKIKRGENIRGVDAWRYVKHVAAPLMWPESRRQLERNPDFLLMEDGAPSHTAHYTTRERKTS